MGTECLRHPNTCMTVSERALSNNIHLSNEVELERRNLFESFKKDISIKHIMRRES